MQTRFLVLGMVICHLTILTCFGHPSSIQISANTDQGTSERNSGVIRGRIFAAEGEYPLARATVTLYSTDGRGDERPRTVRTDSRGEYEFRDLESGKYLLRASRNGYLRQHYGQKTSSEAGRRQAVTPLSLASGQVLDSIDFELIRGGVLEGTVMDQHNEPRSRVSVTLSAYRSISGERNLFPVGRTQTDDRGRFRLFDIPPGSYYLRAAPRAFSVRSGEGNRPFPPTYYPGVLSLQEATKVVVTAGQEVGGFHFTLIEIHGYSVSGRVLTAEGRPAHSVWIISKRESAEAFVSGPETSADTDLQGEFRVSGLLPGRHRLHARAGGDDNPQMASAVVQVTDQDIEGLTLVLGAGAEVTGRIVTDREDSALEWRRTWLVITPDNKAARGFFGGTGGQVEEGLTFKLANLHEGAYHLAVRLPPGNHYVSSIRVGGEDITDRPIELRSNDRLDGVVVHVSSDGARISGVVEENESGQAVEGATVLVFAADSQRRGRHSRFTKTTQTDQRGRFSLKGLVPGEYLLCAVVDHESGLESDLDYLSSLERDSERIDLSSGQTIEESLVALPAPNMK